VLHETLGKFTGLLQSDGYSAYTSYIKKHDMELVSCLAHIWRKFFEARKNHLEKAEYALEQIQLMYGLEQIAREEGFAPAERLGLRKLMAAPMYYNLLEWTPTE